MPESEAKKKWMKENTTFIGLNLNNKTDRDILDALEKGSKQGEIKRLIRLALQYEQTGG